LSDAGLDVTGPEPIEVLADAMARIAPAVESSVRDCEAQLLPRMRRLETAAEAARAAEGEAERRAEAACDEDEDGDDALAELDYHRERRARIERAVDQVDACFQRFRSAMRPLNENKGALFKTAEADLRDVANRLRAYRDHTLNSARVGLDRVQPPPHARPSVNQLGPMEQVLMLPLPPGLAWTPLDLFDAPRDGKGVSKARLVAGARQFCNELVPLLRDNPGLAREDLVAMDKAQGRTLPGGLIHPESLAALYDHFLGGEPIAGEYHSDGQVHLHGGRHRLAALKSIGATHAPMRMTGQRPSP
jgi:hypothetical protein